MERVIEHTADGSATLFVPELDEHYHSVKGAFTESQHIFIDMGLKACPSPTPKILEVGFGTGLNAYLTLLEAERSGRHVHYTGIELYPLPWETIEQLHYNEDERFKALHTAAWEKEIEITPYFTLHKVQADFSTGYAVPYSSSGYDILYFDAFAPEKQPEMWSQELFDRLYVNTSEEGILTTYCAKGVVRRMLQSAGFKVERLPGPPGGKREILRATRLPDINNPIPKQKQ